MKICVLSGGFLCKTVESRVYEWNISCYKRVRHVFQGRYKSILVQDEGTSRKRNFAAFKIEYARAAYD